MIYIKESYALIAFDLQYKKATDWVVTYIEQAFPEIELAPRHSAAIMLKRLLV
jgi:hypothetical protein